MTQQTCPTCRSLVLRTPNGELLDPAPHPLAIHRPDGTDLTVQDAKQQLRGRSPPAGHHYHRCPPRPRPRPSNPDQLTLI